MAFAYFGHFKLKVLNFRLNNDTGHLRVGHEQRLQRRDGKVVSVYLYDILIFLKNLEEHRMHVPHVLRCSANNASLKASKCTFRL